MDRLNAREGRPSTARSDRDDPAGHMADLVESGAVDMELAADADRDEMREFLDRVDVDAAVAKAKHN